MTIHTKPLLPSSQRRLSRWARALRNRRVSAFHWRIIGDERLRASIDRRFDAEFRRGNLPGDVIEVIERELGRGVEYRLAELACARVEKTDAYRERLQALEEEQWRCILNKAWSQSLVSLTDAAYWIAARGEPRDPENEDLEWAARELVVKLQSGELVAFGIPESGQSHKIIPIEDILTATRDGAPIFGESVFGEAQRLVWALIAGEDGDAIESRVGVHWRGVSVKKTDLRAMWPARQHDREASPESAVALLEPSTERDAASQKPTKPVAVAAWLLTHFPVRPTRSNKDLSKMIEDDGKARDIPAFSPRTLTDAIAIAYSGKPEHAESRKAAQDYAKLRKFN